MQNNCNLSKYSCNFLFSSFFLLCFWVRNIFRFLFSLIFTHPAKIEKDVAIRWFMMVENEGKIKTSNINNAKKATRKNNGDGKAIVTLVIHWQWTNCYIIFNLTNSMWTTRKLRRNYDRYNEWCHHDWELLTIWWNSLASSKSMKKLRQIIIETRLIDIWIYRSGRQSKLVEIIYMNVVLEKS